MNKPLLMTWLALCLGVAAAIAGNSSPFWLRDSQLPHSARSQADEAIYREDEATHRPTEPVRSTEQVEREELECLALNVYYEARSESHESQSAVAHVTLNRVNNHNFPRTICGVVKQASRHGTCQFSWVCERGNHTPTEWRSWQRANSVAREAMADRKADPTNGALHFHAVSIHPDWADEKTLVRQIGGHYFYREGRPVRRARTAMQQASLREPSFDERYGIKPQQNEFHPVYSRETTALEKFADRFSNLMGGVQREVRPGFERGTEQGTSVAQSE